MAEFCVRILKSPRVIIALFAALFLHAFLATVLPAQTVGHRTFGIECARCHSSSNWTTLNTRIEFNHAMTGFALSGKHAAATCDGCHAKVSISVMQGACTSCHASPHAGSMYDACAACHGTTEWKSASPEVNAHQRTPFPLVGAHAAAECTACHGKQTPAQYASTSTACYSCHSDLYDNVSDPDHQKNGFDRNCATCHSLATDAGWAGGFRHPSVPIRYLPAHASLECAKCHSKGFRGTPRECYGCHAAEYAAVRVPPHADRNFPRDCTRCHEATAWKAAHFDHSVTRFALAGTHAAIPCSECHGASFTPVSMDCIDCHEEQYASTKAPDHAAAGFPTNCDRCHSFDGWKPSRFDHETTNFRLTGMHRTLACESCHANGTFANMPLECEGCHEKTYVRTTRPNHQAVGFPRLCRDCHNTNGWQPVERAPLVIDHDRTPFPLVGMHRQQRCEQCHVNGMYFGTRSACYGCHQANYNATTAPNHVNGRFNHDCRFCHTMNGWKPANVNHDATNFPLTGFHTTLACERCHVGGAFDLVFTGCRQCHESTYNGTTNPNHAANQFPLDCTRCHNTTGWRPALFNHNNTKFPLTGTHATRACADCHVNGNFQLVFTECYQCHAANYNGTTNPNHASNQFPHTCNSCHNTTAWQPANFDHATTNFPLTGTHATRPCSDCHVNGNFQLVFTECYQCHAANYNGTTNPNHASNQFPHTCNSCHNTTAWQPATFDHSKTNFPLQGAHTTRPCADCHVNGNFQLVFTDCYQCHAANYNAQTSPANHQALNLSHNCATCHTFTSFNPATPFRTGHNVNAPNGFPIYSPGKHNGKWTSCTQCHTTNTTATYCCTNCHTQSKTNGDHSGVGGYSWNCTICTNCHPDGRSG